MFLPTVIIESFCLILNATCFCAFLFVARIANRSEHITNQGGTAMSKRNPRTMCLKNPTIIQMWRLTKGIGLVIKLVEQDDFMLAKRTEERLKSLKTVASKGGIPSEHTAFININKQNQLHHHH